LRVALSIARFGGETLDKAKKSLFQQLISDIGKLKRSYNCINAPSY